MKNPPLDLPDGCDWRSRWLVLPSYDRLHRISQITWGTQEYSDPDEMIEGVGVAVCGASGHFWMPGIFSRMGRPRCSHCCDFLGIPRGDGAPGNAKDVPWKEA